jgi:parvulin-like peptidyl-prolyl isomerase
MLKLADRTITLDEVICYLKKDLQLRTICQNILYQQIIDQTAQAKGVTVTPDEIQQEGDRWRREHRLEKAAETLAWLDQQMLTAEDLAARMRDRGLAQKLTHYLFESSVEATFRQHRVDFEQVLLYQIIVTDQVMAQELYFQIEEREISFVEAAHLYNQAESDRLKCGYAGQVCRWQLKPDIAAAVFSAPANELVGPLKTDQGYHLLWVKELIPAQLTPAIRQELLDGMFQTWLANELDHLLYNAVSA